MYVCESRDSTVVVRSLRLCVDIIVPDNANDTADSGSYDASQ